MFAAKFVDPCLPKLFENCISNYSRKKKKIQLTYSLSLLCPVHHFTLDWILWCPVLLHGLQYSNAVTGGINLALCSKPCLFSL